MRLQSVYVIPCLCGKVVESHEPTATCPKCGKILIVKDWGKP